MDESNEPDQPISAQRQEFRKRRKPSQPMVDKSQQTEVIEKKRHLPALQLPGPKATHSIDNISGSKTIYDSLRLSSQIQQSWTKRKYGQEMTDVSLQTDSIKEEKKEESKSFGGTVLSEEKWAAVGEAATEIPRSVQEVENPPLAHSIQLKIDRSQQTSCTGDWTVVIIPCMEKHDKEQQTYFSESEIVVIGRQGSSFLKSRESMQIHKSSGEIFISEKSESQSTTSSKEKIRQKSITRSSFSQETKTCTHIHSEHEQDISDGIYCPIPEEICDEVQSLPAEETTEEEILAELQLPPTEETPAKIAPVEEFVSEESPDEVQFSPAEESPEEEIPAEVESPSAEESPEEETPAGVQSPPFEEALEEETPDESEPSAAEEAPEEEITAEVEPQEASEVLAEVPSPPAEEVPPEESPDEDQPFPAEEEEASAEVQSLPAEGVLEGDALVEVHISAMEETPDKIQTPVAEEEPTEFQSSPDEETPAEEAPINLHPLASEKTPTEDQPPESEGTTAEKDPIDEQPLSAEEANITQMPIMDAEVQPPPFEQSPVDETVVDGDSTEIKALQTTDVPVIKLEPLFLEPEKKSEEAVEPDLPPEDSSNIQKDHPSTIEIEGVIEIELQ